MALRTVVAWAAACVAGWVGGPCAAATPLGLSCQGCHQPTVNSPEMLALDRLPAESIVRALRAARDMPQSGSIMARFAAHLTDAQIDALARELGSGAP